MLPESYYKFETNKIIIPKGKVRGGVLVQLTDAFFEDEQSADMTYVLPMVLVNGSDSILEGKAKEGVENPRRLVASDWDVTPMDYQLLAIKYKNRYHGVWLSQGKDEINNNGTVTTNDRNKQYWEKADTCWMSTIKLNASRRQFSHYVTTINDKGEEVDTKINITLRLDYTDNGDITVSTKTAGCSASGSGKWEYQAAKKAWGDKDRDQITLNYEYSIPYTLNALTGQTAVYKVKRQETMVMRDRQSKFETFSFSNNQ